MYNIEKVLSEMRFRRAEIFKEYESAAIKAFVLSWAASECELEVALLESEISLSGDARALGKL